MRARYGRSRLGRWTDRNRKLVAEAMRAQLQRPAVDAVCEGGCGRTPIRSAVEGRVVCGDCEFRERCKALLEYWQARRRRRRGPVLLRTCSSRRAPLRA